MAQVAFGPFRLDTTTRQLWRDEQGVAVQPRPLAVLQYLVERPGQVVSSAVMLKAVWAGTYVSRVSLKVCIRAIREALGDDAEVPQYVETVGRLGYRFIAPLTAAPLVRSPDLGVRSQRTPAPSTQHPTPTLVGRDAEAFNARQN